MKYFNWDEFYNDYFFIVDRGLLWNVENNKGVIKDVKINVGIWGLWFCIIF